MMFLKNHFDFFMWFIVCVVITKLINTCVIKQCSGLSMVSCDLLACCEEAFSEESVAHHNIIR
jgi:hypothetical protein